MGFLSRLFGRATAAPALPSSRQSPDWAVTPEWRSWEPPRDWIAGESNHQMALRRLAGPPRPHGWLLPVNVHLTREPRNQYDKNAIRAEVGGELVGYVRREIATQLAPPLRWMDRALDVNARLAYADLAGEVAIWPPGEDEGR